MTQKTRFVGAEEMKAIAKMYDEGMTVTEIVSETGRHHSLVSKVLRSATLSRPFRTKNRIVFSVEEMRQLRALADQGLSAAQIAAQMPGRRKETINGKLQALGYDRTQGIPEETRAIILALKDEGKTIREISALVGVAKSTVATVHTVEAGERFDDPTMRRVIDGDVCLIHTKSGKDTFLVDAADYDLLPQTSIYKGANGYGVARINGVVTYLHHIIMGKPPVGKIVDHINGERKDCRRSNLRFATHSQNAQNARNRGVGRSGHYGVQKTAEGYRASVTLNLGTFDTAEEAARAYDEKAREIFGEFAMTNEKRGGTD